MALASSGTLSINDIAGEFGGSSNPESLSEFYRGGSRVANSSTTSNIPTSGTISISNFYGASASIPNLVTGTVYNTSYGSGKNIGFVGGIRPSQSNYTYGFVGLATNSSIPAGGSWSDDYAEISNVTLLSYFSSGNSFVSSTSLTSGNLTALHGLSCSVTRTTAISGTFTTTITQPSGFTPILASMSPPSQHVVDCVNLIDVTNGTQLTASWT
jgi:hypothetical protein